MYLAYAAIRIVLRGVSSSRQSKSDLAVVRKGEPEIQDCRWYATSPAQRSGSFNQAKQTCLLSHDVVVKVKFSNLMPSQSPPCRQFRKPYVRFQTSLQPRRSRSAIDLWFGAYYIF
jgi:hypothetical protein